MNIKHSAQRRKQVILPVRSTDYSLLFPHYEEDLKRLADFRLMDDTFMSQVLDGAIEAVTLILNIVLQRTDLLVTSVKTQYEYKNAVLRSVLLDIKAIDLQCFTYDIEIQRNNAGASPRRARYHSSMLDTQLLRKNEPFSALKDTYVIFITEHDIYKMKQPLYYVERCITNTDYELFGDGAHIIYVNGEFRDLDHPIGQLMHDFHCRNASEMIFSELADRIRYFKETEGGINHMCQIMEDMCNEVRYQEKLEFARLMLLDNEPIDKIIRYTGLTEKDIDILQEELLVKA